MGIASSWEVSADLFSDERRLAMVMGGSGLQLILRDLDTGKVLSELRVFGASVQAMFANLTCLDAERVFVNDVLFFREKKFVSSGLVWNTSDNSLTVVDTSLKSNPLTTLTSVYRGQQHVMNQAKDRKEIGIWDRTVIRILDSNSLLPIIEAGPPDPCKIEFAHLDSNGELHAVLSSLNVLGPEDFRWASGDPHAVRSALKDFRAEEFRWAKWNRDSKEWQTVFSWKEKKRNDSSDMRWSFDPSQSVLYYMHDRDSGSFQRWSTRDGIELPAMQIPFGNVESFQLNKSGMGVALLKSKVNDNKEAWSATWYYDDIRRSQNIQSSPFVLPLPAKDWWLTDYSVRPGASLETSEPSPILFDGRKLEQGKPNSQLLCSDNHSCLVQFVGGTLHFWLLGDAPDGKSKYVYRYTGASQVAAANADIKASLSSHGNKIAISTGSELRWSTQPFKQWQRVQLNAPSDAKITSIRWSWDNKTVAVGFSNGDAILHDVEIGSSNTLARGHLGAVHDALWLPDRRSIATAGNDGDMSFGISHNWRCECDSKPTKEL